MQENLKIHGHYDVVCYGSDGKIKWEDVIENTVMTLSKNEVLNQALAGSSFTVTGPYMLLISSTSYSAISAADTMASHAGWLEAGSANNPTYSGNRKTCVWSAASAASKALSASLTFNITVAGTCKGAALVFGSGAVNTIDSTAGILLSAGLFSGGDKVLANGDAIAIAFTMSL